MSRAHFLEPVLRTTGTWGLRIVRTDTWLAPHVELAGSSKSRTRGLLGRDALDPGHALVLAPCQGIHTFGMRFAIDVVGVARDGRVVTLRRKVPPRRIVLALRAFAVVELAAGDCGVANLELGDHLVGYSSDPESTG